MRKIERWAASAVVLAALLASGFAGCGDDDGACPDLSGAWTIDQHCVPEYVGGAVSVQQTGCSLQSSGAGFDNFTGGVTASGAINIGGVAGGDVINCAGTAAPTQITLDCASGSCDVVMRR